MSACNTPDDQYLKHLFVAHKLSAISKALSYSIWCFGRHALSV